MWLNHQPRRICKQVYTIINHDPLESLLFYSQLFIVCSNSNETHHAKLHNVFSISFCLVVLVVQVTCNFTSNLIMKDVHILLNFTGLNNCYELMNSGSFNSLVFR